MFYLSHGGWHIFILFERLTWQIVKIFSSLPENVTIPSIDILHSQIDWFGIAKWCGYITHNRQPVKYSPSAVVFAFCWLLTWEKINIANMCVCEWLSYCIYEYQSTQTPRTCLFEFSVSCKKGRKPNNIPFINIFQHKLTQLFETRWVQI